MSHAKISFFGPAQGTDSENVEIPFQRRKSVALLSYLTVTSRQHSRSHLAALLWPDLEVKHARNNLRVASSRLSTALSTDSHSLLISDRHNIQINPDMTLWLDVREFELLVAETKQHEHEQPATCATCHNTLKKAVRLYKGHFLESLSLEDCEEFIEWQSLVREQYRMQALEAFTQLSQFCEHAGEREEAERFTRESLLINPFSEDTNRRLMRLLVYQNKRNEALELFNAYQDNLQNELGVEPEDAIVDLFHQIQAGNVQNTTEAGVCSSLKQTHIKNNLPLDMTSFVGREGDLAHLDDCLKDYRLITLLGIGGTGKTRIALELARRQLQKSITQSSNLQSEPSEFPDGIYFVSLDLMTRVEDIPIGLAKILELKILPVMDVEAQILTYLEDKSMLFVFDNFEHLTQGNAFVNELLKAAPTLKIITTSRQKLGISAEAIYRVSGLDYSTRNDAGAREIPNSAAKLFVESAKRVALDVNLKKDDHDQIIKVSQLTKGHPLALILAAGWVDSLSCEEIFQELSSGISLLESKVQDVPERHRSIYAAFTSSWDLLSESEQKGYMSLNIFRGGFDRIAASEIAKTRLASISNLLNRSLIDYIPETGRYEFHSLMNQFLQAKTESVLIGDEGKMLYKRHGEYFFSALVAWESQFQSNSAEALLAFERDFENVRNAWEWAIDHERVDLLVRGINSLRLFCTLLSRYQALVQLLEPALRLIPDKPGDLDNREFELNLLVSLGTAYISIGGFIAPEVKKSFEQATRISQSLETSSELFSTLNSLCAYYWCIVDFDSCLEVTEQWRDRLSQSTNHASCEQRPGPFADAEVIVHVIEGAVRYQRGEFTLAKEILEKAASLYKPERHLEYIATYGQDPAVFSRYWLARCYWVLGKPEKATVIAQEAVDIAQAFEHPFTKMFAHCAVLDVANFEKLQSDIEAAAQIVSKSAAENDFFLFQAISAISRGLVLCNPGNSDSMREQGLAMMEQSLHAFNMQMVTKETYASHIAHAYVQEEIYDRALNLIDEALEFSELTKSHCSTADLLQLKAKVFAAQGVSDSAEELFLEAIETAVQQGAKMLQLRATTNYAVHLKEQGRFSEARDSISSIYNLFDEGFESVDLKIASAVLGSLESELSG